MSKRFLTLMSVTVTWQEGLTFFVLMVVASFIAAGIRAWLENRHR